MKKLLALILFLTSVLSYSQTNKISLIPQPAEIQQSAGVLRLSGSAIVSYNAPETGSVAEMLALKINIPTGFSIKARHGNNGSIQMIINNAPVDKIGNEGYTLTVSTKNIVIAAIEAARMGHDVVMTPTTFCYLDYQQGEATIEPPMYASLRLKTSYSFNPVPADIDPKHILGGQGNLWSEQISTLRHAEYMTWPRGWALAEVFWTPQEKRSWDDFILRTGNQFVRNDIGEINYSKAIYDPVITARRRDGKTTVTMTSEAPGLDIHYTVDDVMPDFFSHRYTAPFDLPEGGPVTLRVQAYRNGDSIGHLITLNPEDLRRR